MQRAKRNCPCIRRPATNAGHRVCPDVMCMHPWDTGAALHGARLLADPTEMLCVEPFVDDDGTLHRRIRFASSPTPGAALSQPAPIAGNAEFRRRAPENHRRRCAGTVSAHAFGDQLRNRTERHDAVGVFAAGGIQPSGFVGSNPKARSWSSIVRTGGWIANPGLAPSVASHFALRSPTQSGEV